MRLGQWRAFGQSFYNKNLSAMNKALLRISTGYRINSAADDAPGIRFLRKCVRKFAD